MGSQHSLSMGHHIPVGELLGEKTARIGLMKRKHGAPWLRMPRVKNGGDDRIRTGGWRFCKPLAYHLPTSPAVHCYASGPQWSSIQACDRLNRDLHTPFDNGASPHFIIRAKGRG